MAFTRYWTIKKEITQDKFDTFIKHAKNVIKYNIENGIKLGDFNGDDEPVYGDNILALNGVGVAGHESFVIRRIPKICTYDRSMDGWEFCKTARKPYDKVVYELLYLAKYIFGHDLFEYDGDCDEVDNDSTYIKMFIRNNKIDEIVGA